MRFDRTYSIPRDSIAARFSSASPSALTKKTSGLTASTSGKKSSNPAPLDTYALCTHRSASTRYFRSASELIGSRPFSSRTVRSEPSATCSSPSFGGLFEKRDVPAVQQVEDARDHHAWFAAHNLSVLRFCQRPEL
jgi:hypothetical protein